MMNGLYNNPELKSGSQIKMVVVLILVTAGIGQGETKIQSRGYC
jgi:hypothetical protein